MARLRKTTPPCGSRQTQDAPVLRSFKSISAIFTSAIIHRDRDDAVSRHVICRSMIDLRVAGRNGPGLEVSELRRSTFPSNLHHVLYSLPLSWPRTITMLLTWRPRCYHNRMMPTSLQGRRERLLLAAVSASLRNPSVDLTLPFLLS